MTSTETYGGPGHCFGTGQGGGGSTSNWTFLHDVTLRTIESHETQCCVIHDPSTGVQQSRNSNAFADDMNVLSMNTTRKLSMEKICEDIRRIGQRANDCIRASGGSFNLQKCSWRCSVPIKYQGKADVTEIHRELEIIPSPGSPSEIIPRLPKGTPHRQLGVQLVPSLSPNPQLALLRQKCFRFKATIRQNSLSPHQSSTVFEHYIAPAIQYPCTTQAIHSKDIDTLQNIPLAPLLSKLGISTTFARHALFAPSKFGGANLKCWSAEIIGRQLTLLISNFDEAGWLGFILRASSNFTQLEWGRKTHFLAATNDLPSKVCTTTFGIQHRPQQPRPEEIPSNISTSTHHSSL